MRFWFLRSLTCGVATALNNEKAHGVQALALACGFKLQPDQENKQKLKLELHALFPRSKSEEKICLFEWWRSSLSSSVPQRHGVCLVQQESIVHIIMTGH